MNKREYIKAYKAFMADEELIRTAMKNYEM